MILKEAGVQTGEVDKHLSKLQSIKQHFEVINALINKNLSESDLVVMVFVKDVCEKFLFSDYEYLWSAATIVSIMTLRQIKEEESDIPATLQPKVREIKGYCEKIEEQSKKLEILMQKIMRKIDKARDNDFKISEAEMIGFKMDALDLDEALKIMDDYVSRVDRVQKMFAQDVKTYAIEAFGFVVVGGVLSMGGALGAVRLVGGALAVYNLYCLLSKWSALRTKVEELRSKSRTLQQNYKENTRKVETVTKKIGLLPIDK